MLKKFFICLLVLLAFSCYSSADNGKIELDFNFNRGNNSQQSIKVSQNTGKNTKKPQRKEITNAIKIYRYNIPSYINSARYGNVESKTMMGLLYASGWNVEQDYEKAAYWLEDAIIYNTDEKRSVEKAMNYLALLYIEGLGVPKNLKRAEELLFAATGYAEEYDYDKELFPEYFRNYELVKNGKASVLKTFYPEIVSPSGVVTGNNVNVRSGPGTSYRSLGRLDKGVNANVIETVTKLDGVWCHVIFPGGLSEGWIFGKYLKPNQASTKIRLNLFALKIDEKNFPDLSFRSYVRMKFDADMDGILSDEEIKKAERIDLDKYHKIGVHNLKGIEHLKYLKKIDIEEKVGHNIDQSNSLEFINYPELREINVRYCSFQPKSLIIENCPVLEKIDTLANVGEVSIKNCPNLKWLSCKLSHLKKIDYKNFAKLSHIFCDSNRGERDFIPIDFTENKVLQLFHCYQHVNRMQIEKKDGLFCVDLGKHVKIDNIKNIIFESLDKDNPNITKYNKETGEVFFSEKPSELKFYYQTHSPQNYAMTVRMRPYMDFSDFKKLCDKDSPKELIAELNYRGLDVNSKIEDKRPLICEAASCASLKILKTLTDLGADINVSDDEGNTTILRAINSNSDYERVKFFIDMGANVNASNKWGQTPLMQAVEMGNIDTIKMLLEHGADVNVKNSNGTPILMHINPMDDPKVILQNLQTLISLGADVNAKDNDGRTALMYFIQDETGNAEIPRSYIDTLIKAGADINAQDNEGQTVLTFATKYLLYDGYNSAYYYLETLIADLIKAGARGDIRDKSGYCPIEDEKYGKDIRALIKKYQKK